jgi:hypothetical protein
MSNLLVFFEQKGIEALTTGDLGKASAYFGKSENVLPTYHSSYEIKKAIDDITPKYNRANDQRKRVILDSLNNEIFLNYSWKFTPENRNKMMQMQTK